MRDRQRDCPWCFSPITMFCAFLARKCSNLLQTIVASSVHRNVSDRYSVLNACQYKRVSTVTSSSAVAEKPRDVLYYLELSLRINTKLSTCHFTNVHFLWNLLIFLIVITSNLERHLRSQKNKNYEFLIIIIIIIGQKIIIVWFLKQHIQRIVLLMPNIKSNQIKCKYLNITCDQK